MKKILITAGGTSEPIDTVREITNSSTGRLGSVIAESLANSYDVYYVHGKSALLPKNETIKKIPIKDTISLIQTLTELFDHHDFDVIIHAMAISDYHVDNITSKTMIINNVMELYESDVKFTREALAETLFNHSLAFDQKIDSSIDDLVLSMHKNVKVLNMIKQYQPDAFLISFKLQSKIPHSKLFEIAHKQLEKSKSDLVIANLLEEISGDNHHAYFINKEQTEILQATTKQQIADTIKKILKEQNI